MIFWVICILTLIGLPLICYCICEAIQLHYSSQDHKRFLKLRLKTTTPNTIMILPWGSESICLWCKLDRKCSFFKDNPEVPTDIHGIPVKMHTHDIDLFGQIQNCPVPSERVWDAEKIKRMFPNKTEWRERVPIL